MSNIIQFPGTGVDKRRDLPKDLKDAVEQQAQLVGALYQQVNGINQQLAMLIAAAKINGASGNNNAEIERQLAAMKNTLEKGWLQLADALGMGPDGN